MDKLNSLMTNTTSLVGYIALLIVAGSYFGGDPGFQPGMLKGNILESGYRSSLPLPNRSIVILVDGRQYNAELGSEIHSDTLIY